MQKIATPGVHTIAELAAFLDIPESSTVKALAGKSDAGELVVLFIPGDHELNELKADRAVGGFTLLADEEMEAYGLPKGSMGPVGLPKEARVVAARSLQAVQKWVVGANEDGFHYVGAGLGRDFEVDEWADLCIVQPGDSCPECGLPLSGARGIEVSQVFQLGDKYSRAMDATFADEDGTETPFLMGCYGVGITRSLAAIVEQHNDEYGIIWPFSVAPAHVCVIPLTVGDEEVQPAAEKLAADIARLGLEVVIDDRSERAGVKFADADLIGWPLQIVVGKRGLAEGKVEVKLRRTGEKKDIAFSTITELLAFAEAFRRHHQVRHGLLRRAFRTLMAQDIQGVLFDLDGTLLDTHDLLLETFRYATRKVLGRAHSRRPPDGEGGPAAGHADVGLHGRRGGTRRAGGGVPRVQRRHPRRHGAPVPGDARGAGRAARSGIPAGRGDLEAPRGGRCTGWAVSGAGGPVRVRHRLGRLAHAQARSRPGRPRLRPHGENSLRTCLYVGDSPFDLQAGNGAGCQTAAALWGMFPADELRAQQPDFVCGSILEVAHLPGAR